MYSFPQSILSHFKNAGWTPERRQYLSTDILRQIPENHPAINILTTFLGLQVGGCGPGEQCATSDIKFEPIDDDLEEICTWNGLLHTTLIEIAEVHNGHGRLFIDQTGKCYLYEYVGGGFTFCGADFITAMQNLLLGRKLRPILLPGQKSEMLYGLTYDSDHPEVYTY